MEARLKVIDDYRYLVVAIANKLKNPYVEMDDLIQSGFLGLLQAYDKFDSSKNVLFASFAYKYIIGQIYHELRQYNKFSVSRKLLWAIKVIKENQHLTIDEIIENFQISKQLIYDAYDYLDVQFIDDSTLESQSSFDDYLLGLNAVECRLLKAKFCFNMSQQAIAEELQVNQSTISRMLKETLEKIKIYRN